MSETKNNNNTLQKAGNNTLLKNQFYAEKYNSLANGGHKKDGATINLYTNNAAHSGMSKQEYAQALQDQIQQKYMKEKQNKQGQYTIDSLKPNEISPEQLEHLTQQYRNNNNNPQYQTIDYQPQQRYQVGIESPDKLTKNNLPEKMVKFETEGVAKKNLIQYNAEQKSLVLRDEGIKVNVRSRQAPLSNQQSPQKNQPQQIPSIFNKNHTIDHDNNGGYILENRGNHDQPKDNKKRGIFQQENTDQGLQSEKQQKLNQWKQELDEQYMQSQLKKEQDKQQRIMEDIQFEEKRFNEHQDIYKQYMAEQGNDPQKIQHQLNKMQSEIPKDFKPHNNKQQYDIIGHTRDMSPTNNNNLSNVQVNSVPLKSNISIINNNSKIQQLSPPQISLKTPQKQHQLITKQFVTHDPTLWKPTGDFQPGRQDIEMLKGVINQQQDGLKQQIEMLKQQVKQQANNRDSAVNDLELLNHQIRGTQRALLYNNQPNSHLNYSKLQNILVPNQKFYSRNFEANQNNIFNQNLYDKQHIHQQNSLNNMQLQLNPMMFDEFGRLIEKNNQHSFGIQQQQQQGLIHKKIGYDDYGNPQIVEENYGDNNTNNNFIQDLGNNNNNGNGQLEHNTKMIYNPNEYFQENNNNYSNQQNSNLEQQIQNVNQNFIQNNNNNQQDNNSNNQELIEQIQNSIQENINDQDEQKQQQQDIEQQ